MIKGYFKRFNNKNLLVEINMIWLRTSVCALEWVIRVIGLQVTSGVMRLEIEWTFVLKLSRER